MAQLPARLITTALAAALLLPAVASAQDNASASPAPAASVAASQVSPFAVERAPAPTAGPRADAAGPQADRSGVALRARTSENAPAPAPLPRGDTSQNRALMIVGVAALVTGAVIGGDEGTIIMLGGAGIGLYGLYQFLK